MLSATMERYTKEHPSTIARQASIKVNTWRSELSPTEREDWNKIAAQYKPTDDDIEELKDDE